MLGLRIQIPPGHGCLSLVNVVFKVEVSGTSPSLVQRSQAECVFVLCVIRCYNNPLHIPSESRKRPDKEKKEVLIIKPTRRTNFSNLFLEKNSTCFGQFLCPLSGVLCCTHSNGTCHTVLLTVCEQDQDGTAVPS